MEKTKQNFRTKPKCGTKVSSVSQIIHNFFKEHNKNNLQNYYFAFSDFYSFERLTTYYCTIIVSFSFLVLQIHLEYLKKISSFGDIWFISFTKLLTRWSQIFSLTEQQLEPLKSQLEEMDAAIFDQRDRISAIKAIILRNEERTARLLAGINVK